LKEDQLNYLKEMERKLKAMVIAWRKSDDKDEVIRLMQALLFKQKEKLADQKKDRKVDSRFEELTDPVAEGDLVKMQKNRQVGTIKEIRGKKAIVQLGLIPITVDLKDLVKVIKKQDEPSGA
jgi:DNA mismatch repair protein MutS2